MDDYYFNNTLKEQLRKPAVHLGSHERKWFMRDPVEASATLIRTAPHKSLAKKLD